MLSATKPVHNPRVVINNFIATGMASTLLTHVFAGNVLHARTFFMPLIEISRQRMGKLFARQPCIMR